MQNTEKTNYIESSSNCFSPLVDAFAILTLSNDIARTFVLI